MIERELAARGWLGFERVRTPAVDPSVLRAVHPEPYIASIERACRSGGTFLDVDTVVGERSFEAALHAVGGAVRMVDLLLDGDASAAFSSHRPPGHHVRRWASACSTASPWPHGTRSMPGALSG